MYIQDKKNNDIWFHDVNEMIAWYDLEIPVVGTVEQIVDFFNEVDKMDNDGARVHIWEIKGE